MSIPNDADHRLVSLIIELSILLVLKPFAIISIQRIFRFERSSMVESKCQCKRKKVPKKLSKNAVSTALLDNVLGTIAANMKSSDSHNITLTVEQFYGILNEMSDLRSSVNVMEGRLIQLVDDLQKAPTFFGQSLPPEASKPVEESEESISTKYCNYEKFEKDLSAAQHSISKIMAETTLQREEMSAWRDVLQKM